MHDIDRTQLEMEWEAGDYEPESYPEVYDEMYEETYGEAYDELYGEVYTESPFSDADEMELAAELLGVYDEAELDQFLGKLFRKVKRGAKRLFRSPVGRLLKGALRGVAKKALPIAGGALGSMVMPGVGTAIGSGLGSMAGRMFGLELEGMSPEDQEFEVARRFVRFAGEAAKRAATAPPNVPPQRAVRSAVAIAARKHAPGIAGGVGRTGQSGRWVRRGRNIVLLGA